MKHAIFTAVVVVGLALGSARVAHATAPEQARGMEAEVAAQVSAAIPGDLALVDVQVPKTLAATRGEVTVEVRATLRSGRSSVKVTVHGKNGKEKSGWATVVLGVLRPVLVAQRPLAAGDRLAGGAVVVEQRAVDASRACDLSPAVLASATMKVSVPAGGVVVCTAIERPAPVARGSQVRILVKRGAVTIAASGQLEQSVRPGEPAMARLEGSQRILRGKLVDSGTFVMEGE
jgi:flagella basal body P-ring formation protein FlgA